FPPVAHARGLPILNSALPKSSPRRYTPALVAGTGPREKKPELDARPDLRYPPPHQRTTNETVTRDGTSSRPCSWNYSAFSRALLRAGVCGKPALPALLGRGTNLAGPSGYWVGHSSGSFAVELMSDRGPGLVPGPRGITATTR